MSTRVRQGAAVIVFVLALAGAACGRDQKYLPAGTFSGTVGGNHKIVIDVGDKPKVDGRRGEWGRRGEIDVKGLDAVFDCETRARGTELHCTVKPLKPVPGGPATTPPSFDLVRI
jgi:hypothetical protein